MSPSLSPTRVRRSQKTGTKTQDDQVRLREHREHCSPALCAGTRTWTESGRLRRSLTPPARRRLAAESGSGPSSTTLSTRASGRPRWWTTPTTRYQVLLPTIPPTASHPVHPLPHAPLPPALAGRVEAAEDREPGLFRGPPAFQDGGLQGPGPGVVVHDLRHLL